MRKQCQAHVHTKNAQCLKKALIGSRYCYLHHAWGSTAIGSMFLLVAGAALSPLAQQAWEWFVPSASSKLLQKLERERPKFDVLVNGEKLPSNCVTEIPSINEHASIAVGTNFLLRLPPSGEIKFALHNVGNSSADAVMVAFFVPALLTNAFTAPGWRPQPGFAHMVNGKLEVDPMWAQWAHRAEFPLTVGSVFGTAPITYKTDPVMPLFPMVICVTGKNFPETRFATLVTW